MKLLSRARRLLDDRGPSCLAVAFSALAISAALHAGCTSGGGTDSADADLRGRGRDRDGESCTCYDRLRGIYNPECCEAPPESCSCGRFGRASPSCC